MERRIGSTTVSVHQGDISRLARIILVALNAEAADAFTRALEEA